MRGPPMHAHATIYPSKALKHLVMQGDMRMACLMGHHKECECLSDENQIWQECPAPQQYMRDGTFGIFIFGLHL